MRRAASGLALGLGQPVEGFVAQWRVSGALFEVIQQFTGEMRLLRELGSAHDFGERFLRSEPGCRQFFDGIVFQFNRHSRHEERLVEKRDSFKRVKGVPAIGNIRFAFFCFYNGRDTLRGSGVAEVRLESGEG